MSRWWILVSETRMEPSGLRTLEAHAKNWNERTVRLDVPLESGGGDELQAGGQIGPACSIHCANNNNNNIIIIFIANNNIALFMNNMIT